MAHHRFSHLLEPADNVLVAAAPTPPSEAFVACPGALLQDLTLGQFALIQEVYRVALARTQEELRSLHWRRLVQFSLN